MLDFKSFLAPALLAAMGISACAPTRYVTKDSFIKEGPESIYAVSKAPIPQEITNKSQAMSLARDAAVTLGQTSLLTYLLDKKTHSKKTLAEAEVPYIKLQVEIRGMVQGAEVVKTVYDAGECEVTLAISKSQVKELLKKN